MIGLLLVAAAASPAAAPVWRVAPVVLPLPAGAAIGPKRSGTLCLPAGSIHWREAKPEEGEARAALAEGLRAGGLVTADPGNPFGDGGEADRAVRVALHGVRLSACVPPDGLGRVLNRSRAIKGDGVIAVGWQAFARGRTAATDGGEACVAFGYREGIGTLARMVLVGLRAAGERIATGLRGGTAPVDDARCGALRGAPLPAAPAAMPGPEGQAPG